MRFCLLVSCIFCVSYFCFFWGGGTNLGGYGRGKELGNGKNKTKCIILKEFNKNNGQMETLRKKNKISLVSTHLM